MDAAPGMTEIEPGVEVMEEKAKSDGTHIGRVTQVIGPVIDV